jgi:hypothetical protein
VSSKNNLENAKCTSPVLVLRTIVVTPEKKSAQTPPQSTSLVRVQNNSFVLRGRKLYLQVAGRSVDASLIRESTMQAIAVILSVCAAATAYSAQEHQPVTLTMYSDDVGGEDLVRGDYQAAINKISGTSARPTARSLANTNLCVARIKSGELGPAQLACDNAIKEAKALQLSTPTWGPQTRSTDYVAVALVNRAVLRWLLNDDKAAARDLAAAKQLAPRSSTVRLSLTTLTDVR